MQVKLFDDFKKSITSIDPVEFCENNLTLDGHPFNLRTNGYKPFSDIYRYIGIKALEKDSKKIVLVKGRQVGATTMCAALELYFAGCNLFGNNGRPPVRMMHLFPSLILSAAYTKDKLDPMIAAAKSVPGKMKKNGTLESIMESKFDKSSPSNNNQSFKKFLGGNQIWIESTGATGDRVRGRTVDIAFYDEIQDIPATAIGASSKILTKSNYGRIGEGVQVFFGTPKQKNTAYYNMWRQSNQQYFHLFCENCEKHFPLYRPDVNWEEIWLYGFIVKCTHCGHEQDKVKAANKGKWIGLENSDNYEYVGFHINQLYIPDFPKEVIIKNKPELNPNNTERIYQNEVLGEFYDGEGTTITEEEIHANCADHERKFIKYISYDSEYKTYLGFDWGQKGDLYQMAGKQKGQSYSCGVVLTVKDSIFNIEFATILQKTDPESKVQVVEEMFRRYSPHLCIGDIGDAHDLTHVLQRKYGEKFLASRALSQCNGKVHYREDIFPKEIGFEKDYYISELIGLLKKGQVRFPYGSYEKITWLIKHCCSMDIKITQGSTGELTKRYVKGPTPNDGFMALLNAYLAYKFDITQGFNIKQPRDMKYGNSKRRSKIDAVIGHCKF